MHRVVVYHVKKSERSERSSQKSLASFGKPYEWHISVDGQFLRAAPSQEAAEEYARTYISMQRSASLAAMLSTYELTTHGRDGRIREAQTRGHDPCPPRDLK